MKRYGTKTAIFLLAVYLPMWLLSSLHVHHYHLDNNGASTEQRSADSDEDKPDSTDIFFRHLELKNP